MISRCFRPAGGARANLRKIRHTECYRIAVVRCDPSSLRMIGLNAESRDDIPALLIGLQTIYTSEATWTDLFGLPDKRILPARDIEPIQKSGCRWSKAGANALLAAGC